MTPLRKLPRKLVLWCGLAVALLALALVAVWPGAAVQSRPQYMDIPLPNGEVLRIDSSQLTDVVVLTHNWVAEIGGRPFGLKQVGDCDCTIYLGRRVATIDVPAVTVAVCGFSLALGLVWAMYAFMSALFRLAVGRPLPPADYTRFTADQGSDQALGLRGA